MIWRGHAIPWANIVTSLSGSFVDKSVTPLPLDYAKANSILDALGYKRGANGIRAVPATGGEHPQAAHEMSYAIAVPTDLDFNGDRVVQQLAAGWARIGVQSQKSPPETRRKRMCTFKDPMQRTTRTTSDFGTTPDTSPEFILDPDEGEWGDWNVRDTTIRRTIASTSNSSAPSTNPSGP